MIRISRFVFALVLCLALSSLADQSPVVGIGSQIDSLLEEQVAANGPGVVVLVAKGETLLLETSRGMASLELKVPLTPKSTFRIGSLTKQFTAATVLAHVDRNELKTSDTLSTYLPTFPSGQTITITELLNHTSGIKNFTSIPGYMGNPHRRELTTEELLAVFSELPLEFSPGTNYRYTNSGYAVLGAVLEKLTGKPWYEDVSVTVHRAGLEHTFYGEQTKIIDGMAQGYSTSGDGGVEVADLMSMSQPHAAGALVSSAEDLWKWNLALHTGKLLSADSYAHMTTSDGPAAERGHYGYGLTITTLRGRPAIVHGGAINGFGGYLIWLPTEQLTVVVLRNSDGAGPDPATLARLSGALALGDPFPSGKRVEVPAAALRALQGRWRPKDSAEESTIRIDHGQLVVQLPKGPPRTLTPVGKNLFVASRGPDRLEPQREPTVVRWFPNGEGPGDVWQRVGDLPPERVAVTLPKPALEALVGVYKSPYVTLKISLSNDKLVGEVSGMPPFILQAESSRRLFSAERDLTIDFAPATGPSEIASFTQSRGKVDLRRETAK